MKKICGNLILVVFLLGATLMFTACNSDDKEPSDGRSQYSVELLYEGDFDKYFNIAIFDGGGLNNLNVELIDDETGKTLPSNGLNSDTYNFKSYNKFSLSKKVSHFGFRVSAMTYEEVVGGMTVTVKVYKDGKLIDTISDTASTSKKASINKSYGDAL